jgi:GTPase-associated protein 1, N-terminal domain type 2/GTPase-associated protein 1, C-terminal domain/GTPase-associated protein 1, middle domain
LSLPREGASADQMAFLQLYYTSCERGLAGFPGYQFNAATPGVREEVMREVERNTAYEPPFGIVLDPSRHNFGIYPESLCFWNSYATVLSRAVFTGFDFSRRFGNYFVHALVATDPEAGLGHRLPIETWKASFWISSTAQSTQLPALEGPPSRGPIDRSRVRAFLEGRGESGWLAALLSAAERAVNGQDRVILVSADAEENAFWIAAVSYLLPGPVARRMSFTTYHRRPNYSPFHLTGTLEGPEEDWASGFAVFDFVHGRCSSERAEPAADLLARVGPELADQMWEQVAALAGSLPATLEECHGALAAAGAALGIPLIALDLRAAIDWYAGQAENLPPDLACLVAEGLLSAAIGEGSQLRAVVAGVRRSGAGDLLPGLGELEAGLVDQELDRVLAGERSGELPLSIESPAVLHQARRRCREALRTADVGPVLGLLRWAQAAHIEIEDAALKACGQRLAGELLAMAGEPGVQEVTSAWLPLRAGIVSYLARAAHDDPGLVLEALSEASRILRPEDFSAEPVLGTMRLIVEGRIRPERRVSVLTAILGSPESGWEGSLEDLVGLLWPEGKWLVEDARHLVRIADQAWLTSAGISRWVSAALVDVPPGDDPAGWQQYRRLCIDLFSHSLRGLLSSAAQQVLEAAEKIEAADQRLRDAPVQAANALIPLAESFDTGGEPVQTLLAERLPDLIRRLEGPVMADVLAHCSQRISDRYLARVRSAVEQQHPDARLVASLFLALHRLVGKPVGEGLHRLLERAAGGWGRRSRQAVVAQVQLYEPALTTTVERWLKEQGYRQQERGITRLFRR